MDILQFLYGTRTGRILLRPLVSRPVSAVCGKVLDTRLSSVLIRPFAAAAGIDTEQYDLTDVKTFNDFFCRPIREGLRPVDRTPSHLIAPCDGLLSICPLEGTAVLPIKGVPYTLPELLGSKSLAGRYAGGTCFVFRLCVEHYHRYCYAEGGRKSRNRKIPGVFHTVRPVALETVPVFRQNSREYTLIRTGRFGTLLQMEVGAMLVGRICNLDEEAQVERGQQKGMFRYGGSTIILLVQAGRISLGDEMLSAMKEGREVPVRMGCMIARSTADDI